jgi:hypothetical protein
VNSRYAGPLWVPSSINVPKFITSGPFGTDGIFDAPLTVEELEDGLRLLDQGVIEADAFWDENLEAFRQAMLVAIRETSDLLFADQVPRPWRMELEVQLIALRRYVEIVDRYVAKRAGNWQGPVPSGARLN